MDVPSIAPAISGLKSAAEIARAMKGLHDLADVQTKVIDLQSAILEAQSNALTAQSEQFTMIQRINDLEKELAQAKAWKEEKERYQLITPWNGCHVYALKESSKGTDPPHWVCPHCFDDAKKSMLHDAEIHDRRRRYIIK